MTKTKLADQVLKPMKLMLSVSGDVDVYDGTFRIEGSNDAIDEDDPGINVPGLHFVKNDIIPVNTDYGMYSIGEDALQQFRNIEELKGRGRNYTIVTGEDSVCIHEELDNRYFPITYAYSKKPINGTFLTFEGVHDLEFGEGCDAQIFEYTEKELRDIMNNKVATLTDGDKMKVRVSKNCFPFIGVVKTGSDPNFKGIYRFKKIGDQVALLISEIQYRYLTAIHVYSFIMY